ncbi:MAG: signal peptidase I [Clostridiaceae bacterium]|nr:signal peptidase I [Clostridiaceae bacterium]
MEWIQAIVIALVIAFVIRTFFFTMIRVDGQSMEPTLHHNDRLIVTKFMYKPKQGDIIILRPPMHKDTPYVKRIIALPGQEVNIDFENKIVYVDGVPLDEPYIAEPTATKGDIDFPVVVPEDTVFVLGDNRNRSRDSRFSDVGMIPFDSIIGKATIRLWPLKDFGSIYK